MICRFDLTGTKKSLKTFPRNPRTSRVSVTEPVDYGDVTTIYLPGNKSTLLQSTDCKMIHMILLSTDGLASLESPQDVDYRLFL